MLNTNETFEEYIMNTSMNKMAKAKKIYATVTAKGYNLRGSSVRAVFLNKAMKEVGLTKAGAATYYQNIRNEVVNGKSLYEYNKTAKKVTSKQEPKAEEKKAYVPEFRWTVAVDGEVVESFPSRAKAQARAKEIGGKWGDTQKK